VRSRQKPQRRKHRRGNGSGSGPLAVAAVVQKDLGLEVVAMRPIDSNRVYLEAPDRTQDLLNIKWTLRSLGYSIVSSWHDAGPTEAPALKHHWNADGLEQLKNCDLLVVICSKEGQATPELAMMAGFALARGIRVFWIGSPIAGLSGSETVTRFDSPERFRRELLSTARFQAAA
jgi:hypothetical protein